MDEESDDKDDTKRKSRNLSEKKRRDQFNSLVNDLSALITTSNRKMDKSTVLKSTIAFLKNHNEATDRSKVFEIQQDWKPTFITNDEFTHLMLESLDGFMMVFGSMGSIFYTSESITSQLGYLPHELYNMSIYDLAYEMDHEALLNIFLNPTPLIEPHQTDIETSNQITFYTHLKRGGIEKADSNSYELVKFVGYFRHDANVNTGSNSSDSQSSSSQTLPRIFQQNPNVEVDKSLVFVGTGRIQTPQLIREMSIIDPTSNEFTSKHSMEWKFLFLDHRAPPIIGYMPFEVLGTSGYDYYHFDDLDAIVACHEELRQNGEGKSCYYRFLTKGQQWIWLQTDYYVSYHQYTSKPDYVVCTHKVVSYAEVLKQNKKDRKKANKAQASNSNSSSKCASATTTLRDFELSHQSLDSTLLNTTLANLSNEVAAAAAAAATSPEIDASPMWSGAGAATAAGSSCPVNSMKTSRPASSYGNISSTGISPKAKRKCYFYTNRGNDSDSTSMSAESVTSRQSLMTHASSQSQRSRSHHGREHINNNHQQQQHQQQQQQQHISHHHLHQQQLQPKIVPMLPLAPTQIVTSNPCSFPQANYPLTSPQLVAPSFLEPPQYLAAIPMQPVMAPFPVAPVLSPLPLPVSVPVSVSLPMPVQSQADMLPGAVVMTSTQSHLQDQLQRKHDELQKLIMQQQDELRIVSEQLLLARYTYLQPMMPMGFAASNMAAAAAAVGNAAGVNVQRSFNFSGTNAVEPQFNQYGFALNSEQMLNQQDQQMLMQQQQNLHNQQQHNHQIQQHQQQQNQLQQQQQQLQHQQQQLQLQQQHHQQQQQQLQQQQQQQQQQQSASSMLSREDIEDIDAFLNLSPLQTLGSSNNNNNNNNNNSSNNNNNNSNAPQNTNEDSLLSYMQMATESSPSLNFPMGISDDGSETHSEENKMLRTSSQSLHHHQQQLQQQQQQHQQHHHSQQLLQQQQQQLLQSHQQSNSFFSSNPFQSLSGNHQNQSHQQLPNDLEILPYQMSQEQSQNLFNSPHTANSSQ